jgi:DNA-binding NtrC family response regulator
MDNLLSILIVDDESSQRTGLAGMVKAWGMRAETATDGADALEKLETFRADVIVTDLNMPRMDGYEFIRALREQGETIPIVVVTAFGNVDTAVRTIHEMGAYWFLEKPIQSNVMQVLLRRAAAHHGLGTEKKVLERQLQYKGSLGEMVGTSPRMQEIYALLQQAGPSKACVLISGESGTGKEVVSRTLHALSPRKNGPFVAINCAALPESLIESELFGHEKGSFTGATERRAGCFEVAQNGTLLLDEIGEMPLPTQAKLLRVLEDSKVRRLGGKIEFEVDVRVIAATNKIPDEAVKGGNLREDLYYRLNVFHVHLPPLRERKEDIVEIAQSLMQDMNKKHDTRVSDMSPEVIEIFQKHDWPGNIRELRNVIERSVILTREGTIQVPVLPSNLNVARPTAVAASVATPAAVTTPAPVSTPVTSPTTLPGEFCGSEPLSVPIGSTVDDAEKGLILRTLEHTRQNKTRAAEILGISPKTLQNKLREYGAKDE